MRVFDRYRRNPRHGPLPIPPFNTAKTSHYVFVWDLRWQVLECQRFGAGRGLVRRDGGEY